MLYKDNFNSLFYTFLFTRLQMSVQKYRNSISSSNRRYIASNSGLTTFFISLQYHTIKHKRQRQPTSTAWLNGAILSAHKYSSFIVYILFYMDFKHIISITSLRIMYFCSSSSFFFYNIFHIYTFSKYIYICLWVLQATPPLLQHFQVELLFIQA